MSPQQHANLALETFQATRHLPDALRQRAIDEAFLLAANSNDDPAVALWRAQLDAVRLVMGAPQ